MPVLDTSTAKEWSVEQNLEFRLDFFVGFVMVMMIMKTSRRCNFNILIQLKLGDLKDEKTEQKSFNIEIWNLLLATRLFVSDYAFIFIFSQFPVFPGYVADLFAASCFLCYILLLVFLLPRLLLAFLLAEVKERPSAFAFVKFTKC